MADRYLRLENPGHTLQLTAPDGQWLVEHTFGSPQEDLPLIKSVSCADHDPQELGAGLNRTKHLRTQ